MDLLDAGCGECYYTAAVAAALRTAGKCVGAAGVDISKDALRWGGKRAPDLQLAVASVFRLPVAAKSCDILLNVFAPLPEKNTSGCCGGWCAAARRSGCDASVGAERGGV